MYSFFSEYLHRKLMVCIRVIDSTERDKLGSLCPSLFPVYSSSLYVVLFVGTGDTVSDIFTGQDYSKLSFPFLYLADLNPK